MRIIFTCLPSSLVFDSILCLSRFPFVTLTSSCILALSLSCFCKDGLTYSTSSLLLLLCVFWFEFLRFNFKFNGSFKPLGFLINFILPTGSSRFGSRTVNVAWLLLFSSRAMLFLLNFINKESSPRELSPPLFEFFDKPLVFKTFIFTLLLLVDCPSLN